MSGKQQTKEQKLTVQTAYNLYQDISEKFKKEDSIGLSLVLLQKLEKASLHLWTVIAETTKDINPGLMGDIERHPDRFKNVSASELCWMSKSWHVLGDIEKCAYCHKTHGPEIDNY